MKRSWLPLVGVLLALSIVASGLAWLTRLTIVADRHRARMEAEARQQQQVSLALWRMDTMLAPIMAREVARPWWTIAPDWPVALPNRGEWVGPLAQAPDYVRFHFHWPIKGAIGSPQLPLVQQVAVPAAPSAMPLPAAPELEDQQRLREELSELAAELQPEQWLAELPDDLFPSYDPGRDEAITPIELAENWSPRNSLNYRSLYFGNSTKGSPPEPPVSVPGPPNDPPRGAKSQAADSEDMQSRSARYQVQTAQAYLQQRELNNTRMPDEALERFGPVREGISRAIWMGPRLLLARRVVAGEQIAIQGCELDWPRLKSELLAEVAGLLPNAELRPVATPPIHSTDGAVPARVLAGLPVQLIVNWGAESSGGWSAIQLAWIAGWLGFVLAAVGIVGAMTSLASLSDKRASFVSAVTHELRTPLTTFRLYSQMLARDMVPEASRGEYLQSLCDEADRLNHLIDNVLTYARLERGRSRLELSSVPVGALIDRVRGRLAERAGQAGMELVCEVEPEAAEREVLVDQDVVEQILFNLVDNAAKYAVAAEDRRIHCRVTRGRDSGVTIAVVDHGPGLSDVARRQLFRPFSKSAEQAAASAPGVGLGLALSRRLARQIGGRLMPADEPVAGIPVPQGCAMLLSLPA